MVAAVKLADRDRTMRLRQRCLTVILDGLRAHDREPLPQDAPSWAEISQRWVP
jgi:hypothetical protein